MYTAAILEDTSHHLLRWIAKGVINPEDLQLFNFDGFCDHMTINLGRFDESLNSKSVFDRNVILKVNKIVYNTSLGVCVAIVESAVTEDGERIESSNLIRHITIATMSGVPPKTSNQMLESGKDNIKIKLDQTYELEAYVGTQ